MHGAVRNENDSFLGAYCLRFMRLALIYQTMNESATSILFIFNSAYCLLILTSCGFQTINSALMEILLILTGVKSFIRVKKLTPVKFSNRRKT